VPVGGNGAVVIAERCRILLSVIMESEGGEAHGMMQWKLESWETQRDVVNRVVFTEAIP